MTGIKWRDARAGMQWRLCARESMKAMETTQFSLTFVFSLNISTLYNAFVQSILT